VVPNAVNTLDPHLASCEKASEIRGTTVQSPKTPPAKPIAANPSVAKPITARSLTEGQKAYEAKRAAKAGMSLDKWLASKEREKEAEAKAKQKAAEAAKPPKPPGFFGRLLERAQRPLGS
jgi:hypothetical protein